MIKIEMTGICKDCPCAELQLERMDVEQFNAYDTVYWDIHCEHEEACERVFKGRFKDCERESEMSNIS